MFGQRAYADVKSSAVRDMDKRLHSIEEGMQRFGDRAASKAGNGADHVSEAIIAALAAVADRFRGLSIGGEAAKFGEDALRLGNTALGRLSREVERRPAVTLGVAAGLALLAGLIIFRRH
jgi:ElaB/YqjD/DUF883 family membrane-anchored ribosome-binding protein